MPNSAIYKNKLITVSDIYKYDISKNADFKCYTCGAQLYLRQSRNGDTNYTEHFYHKNNIKDTHIDCENNTYEKIKGPTKMSKFHTMFSNLVKSDSREILREHIGYNKHILDGYDNKTNIGIEFQNSPISCDDIKSRDSTSELDWIFNVQDQFIRRVNIGDFIICEIPHSNWEEAVKVVKNNIFLYTSYKEWIWLTDRESYRIEVEGKVRNVWIGEECTLDDVLDNSCLRNIITNEGLVKLNSISNVIETVKIIYGRCKKSMYLLDTIHREYVKKYSFNNNDILAIKSVAGSGKTTTLLNLSKIHNDKKILYLAFNKSLITEIKQKIKSKKIKNLEPKTFDSLLYSVYYSIFNSEPNIVNIRPQFIGHIVPWLKDKPYKVREYYCKQFSKFCNDIKYDDINLFSINYNYVKKPLLDKMWKYSKQNNFNTFESIRKHAFINKWFLKYINNNYDMIMIDETQDFDLIMLTMLLRDTTIPKIFVGDPNQSIYQFRGCINAFEYLPKDSLVVEFYSTYRIGNPACDEIRSKFNDCWMVSLSKNATSFVDNYNNNENFIHLFRKWRTLLETAEHTKNLWIYNFEKKINEISKLHPKLLKIKSSNIEDDSFEDDLPVFLKSLSTTRLEELILNISDNLVDYEESAVKFYTVHSYKGMENNNVMVNKDVLDMLKNDSLNKVESNIYYVSITRGMKTICLGK